MSDNTLSWVDKYQPSKLDDLCIDEASKKTILGFGKNIPHLLFCGIQGSGKTTLAKIIVKDILKCDYLYINASDESGVDTIRTKVSGFAHTKSLDGNIKVVVLDEGDFLSTSSQAALRNLIDENSKTTKFIITGNYKHKIIPALQSRCQNLHIKPSIKDCARRCFDILEMEGVETSQEENRSIIGIIKRNFPDIRQCINEIEKHITGDTLSNLDNSKVKDILNKIWDNILNKKSFSYRKNLIEGSSDFNYDWDQLLVDLLNFIYDVKYDESVRNEMIIDIADHLDRATRVIDKEINFFACLLNLEKRIS